MSKRLRSPNLAPEDTKTAEGCFLGRPVEMSTGADGKRKPFTKAEQQKFRRFQKDALKAGLVVNRNSYELYFRNALAD